jgi:hypothetical protein
MATLPVAPGTNFGAATWTFSEQAACPRNADTTSGYSVAAIPCLMSSKSGCGISNNPKRNT